MGKPFNLKTTISLLFNRLKTNFNQGVDYEIISNVVWKFVKQPKSRTSKILASKNSSCARVIISEVYWNPLPCG